MSSTKIQESLIEIEENLKHLQSARNQVVSVTDGSQKLSEKVLHLVNNFQQLNEDLNEENNTIIKELSKHNSAFKERVSVITNNIELSVGDLVDKIKASSNKFSLNLDDVSLRHKTSAEKLINDKEKVLNSIIDKHQALSNEIVKIKNQLSILDFHNETKQIITKLKELDNLSQTVKHSVSDNSKAILLIEEKAAKRFDELVNSQENHFEILTGLLKKGQKRQILYFIITILLITLISVLIYFK